MLYIEPLYYKKLHHYFYALLQMISVTSSRSQNLATNRMTNKRVYHSVVVLVKYQLEIKMLFGGVLFRSNVDRQIAVPYNFLVLLVGVRLPHPTTFLVRYS